MINDAIQRGSLLVQKLLLIIIQVAVFGLCGAGVTALWNEFSGSKHSVSETAIMGSVIGAATILGLFAKHIGWGKMRFFWPDRTNLKRRLAELAADREQMIQHAKKN